MNRITVNIAGRDFTLLTDSDPALTQRSAQVVSAAALDITGGTVASYEAMVLTAMTVADKYLQELESADNLRRQLKNSLDQSSDQHGEVSDLKQENRSLRESLSRAKDQLQSLQSQLIAQSKSSDATVEINALKTENGRLRKQLNDLQSHLVQSARPQKDRDHGQNQNRGGHTPSQSGDQER